MMRKLTTICMAAFALLALPITVTAQHSRDSLRRILPDTIVVNRLRNRLDTMSIMYENNGMDISFDDISDNPLYYKLFMPLVLYRSAVSEAIVPDAENGADNDSLLPVKPLDLGYDNTLSKMIDEVLVKVYLEHPELVEMTEAELMNVPGVIPISEDITSGIQLKDARQGYEPASVSPEREIPGKTASPCATPTMTPIETQIFFVPGRKKDNASSNAAVTHSAQPTNVSDCDNASTRGLSTSPMTAVGIEPRITAQPKYQPSLLRPTGNRKLVKNSQTNSTMSLKKYVIVAATVARCNSRSKAIDDPWIPARC